jgi:hypothetical protein
MSVRLQMLCWTLPWLSVGVGLAQPMPDTLWTRRVALTGDQYASDVVRLLSGDIFVVGESESTSTGPEGAITFIASSLDGSVGTIRHYPHSYLASADETTSGDIVTCGAVYDSITGTSNYLLVRVNPLGQELWVRSYPTDDYDDAYDVEATSDGGFVLAGESDHGLPVRSQIYLVKVHDEGDTLWTRFYAQSGFIKTGANDVEETADGGLILAGHKLYAPPPPYPYVDHAYIVRLNSTGDTLWTSLVDTSRQRRAIRVRWLPGGGYLVVGNGYSSAQGDWVAFAAMLQENGNVVWVRDYDNYVPGCGVLDMQVSASGGCLLSGYDDSPSQPSVCFFLMEINAQGDTLWTVRYPYMYLGSATGITQLTDRSAVVVGQCGALVDPTRIDIGLMRTGPIQGNSTRVVPRIRSFSLEQNYPNPFNGTTQIEFTLPVTQQVSLRLYDVLGREVAVLMNEIQTAGQHRLSFDATGLASGVYVCRLEAGTVAQTRKMVLVK